jgi:DNA-binding NtrC family response regulator
MNTVLIVDDEDYIREELGSIIASDDRQVLLAADGAEALRILDAEKVDLVITDINMPNVDGFELIERAHEKRPALPIITITAYGSTQTAVRALKTGAYDFVTKPFSVEEISNIVAHTLQAAGMFNEINYLRGRLQKQYSLENIIGQCAPMQKVFDTITRVAPAPCNVLITGESGTGKELVAQAIHQKSPRHNKRFIPINCGSIPEGLLESELFGHVKGSFTDAVTEKQGLVQASNGGTLFLDEIGDMPTALQVRLLRVIQNRQVQKVGSTQLENVDVRIIAATNQDLAEKIEQKLFREDLYYRINVVEIKLPPLRERTGDIDLLASHFLKHYASILKKNIEHINPQVIKIFQRYSWPGNVRELENAIERSVTFCEHNTITLEDIPAHIRDHVDLNAPSAGSLGERMSLFEQECLVSALERNSMDLEATARELDVSMATLYRKLKKHNLPMNPRIIELPPKTHTRAPGSLKRTSVQ